MNKYIAGLMTGATIMGIGSYMDGTVSLLPMVMAILVTIVINLLLLLEG